MFLNDWKKKPRVMLRDIWKILAIQISVSVTCYWNSPAIPLGIAHGCFGATTETPTETLWPADPKIFTMGSSRKKCATPDSESCSIPGMASTAFASSWGKEERDGPPLNYVVTRCLAGIVGASPRIGTDHTPASTGKTRNGRLERTAPSLKVSE